MSPRADSKPIAPSRALAGNDAGVYGDPISRPTSTIRSWSRLATPDAGTAFVLYREPFKANASTTNGVSYLQITDLVKPGDPRGKPPYISTSAESLGFGLHLVDWNLPMQDLIDIVAQQAAKAVP